MGVGWKPAEGYKKIRVHLVYDVKVTLDRKSQLVADGHLTETPIDGVYSSVVSLRGLKITLLIAEINQMEAWCTDIGNVYLEAYMEELLYIIAGPEFGDLEGHTMIVIKALYRTKTGGVCWWERFSNVLHKMGFYPSLAEDDIWI